MAKESAGLLMYRRRSQDIEVFLVHPGGPFWVRKDLGAWSIPKGEYAAGESPMEAAKREFQEETGLTPSATAWLPLTPVRQPSGKIVYAWAFEGDADPAAIKSNTFPLEWPPGSGKQQSFPEVDRAGWFALAEAKHRIQKGQAPLVAELEQRLATR